MSKFNFKNIELSQWIKPHLATYFLVEDEADTLRNDYEFENIHFLTWNENPDK